MKKKKKRRFRLIVAGSRDVAPNTTAMSHLIHTVLTMLGMNAHIDKIKLVHGACPKGVDLQAGLWAQSNTSWCSVREFPADWDAHGKAAGPMRNRKMAKYSDALLAIWDGKSRGTKNMIEEMKRLEKPVAVFQFEKAAIL